MKIDSSSYSLASSHIAFVREESTESLRAWTGEGRPDFGTRPGTATSAVSLSSAARTALAEDIRAAMDALPAPQAIQPAPASEVTAIKDAADAVDNDPFLMLIKSMVEMFTGKPIRIFSAQELQPGSAAISVTDPKEATQIPAKQAPQNRSAGFGIEYDYHAVHEEFEQTRFSAAGTIKTTDGQEIGFTLDLSMTRSYREETSVSLRAGDAVRKDPLVLNFNGAAAQLSNQRFAFDIMGNGTLDDLALLTGGSGYLAIDRNGNGRIDSGRELFGPATNSGFAELAELDGDSNGWIDENDLAFAALRVWTPDAKGDGKLETLSQRGVGAIALGNVVSSFELRGTGNADLGAVVASGVFLTEDGRPGAIQEVDLTV